MASKDDVAVQEALKKIENAASMWDATALLYLSAGKQAEQMGEIALSKFSVAYAMNSFARAEGLRAQASLTVAQISDVGADIVAALRKYDNEKNGENDSE